MGSVTKYANIQRHVTVQTHKKVWHHFNGIHANACFRCQVDITNVKKVIMTRSASMTGTSPKISSNMTTHSCLCSLVILLFSSQKENGTEPEKLQNRLKTQKSGQSTELLTLCLFSPAKTAVLIKLNELEWQQNFCAKPEVLLSSTGERTGGDETGIYETFFLLKCSLTSCQEQTNLNCG